MSAKVGQPRVLGEIIAGILIGPSVLGAWWPQELDYVFPSGVISALKVLAQFGLVIFMCLIGLEFNFQTLRGQGHKAALISQASIVAPILLGSGLALWLYLRLGAGANRLGFVLFMGAAMSITAFPVLARLLRETGLIHTRTGALAMTCAAIDDIHGDGADGRSGPAPVVLARPARTRGDRCGHVDFGIADGCTVRDSL